MSIIVAIILVAWHSIPSHKLTNTALQPSKSSLAVGPVMLGFFLFVVVGSGVRLFLAAQAAALRLHVCPEACWRVHVSRPAKTEQRTISILPAPCLPQLGTEMLSCCSCPSDHQDSYQRRLLKARRKAGTAAVPGW